MSQISIALCDDNRIFLEHLRGHVETICAEYGAPVALRLFSASTEFLDAVEAGLRPDIALLDIEMPGFNGVQLGRLLREKYRVYDTKIIYVTAYPRYINEAVEVGVWGYLNKPLDHSALQRHLNNVLHQVTHVDKIAITADGGVNYIPVNDIFYFEKQQRQVRVLYREEGQFKEIKYPGKLREELGRLNPRRFVQAHAAYIVSLEHVRRVESKQIVFKGGPTAWVSRHKVMELRQALGQYAAETSRDKRGEFQERPPA